MKPILHWFCLEHVPDLSLFKYQSLDSTGVDGLLIRQGAFLRQWHGICLEARASIHLLYVFDPKKPLGKRLDIYLGISSPEENMSYLETLLSFSPLGAYYEFTPVSIPDLSFAAGATLTKRERVAEISNPLTGTPILAHYVPSIEPNAKARLMDLCRLMEASSSRAADRSALAYRVDLYPDENAVSNARASLMPMLRELSGDEEIRLTDTLESIKSNEMTRTVSLTLEHWIEETETSPCYRANIYAFAQDQLGANVILNAASAEALSAGDVAITPISLDLDGRHTPLSRLGDAPRDYTAHFDCALLPQWPTSFSLNEIAPWFRLPALYDGESIEIPKETSFLSHGDGVGLGLDSNGYPVTIPLGDLPKHGLFSGMPGAGKTNTMLHLATEIHRRGVPFLALEPAKKEYRSLLLDSEMEDVHLFSPHLCSHFPLRVNPMDFPKGTRLSEHIDALIEIFEGSFFLHGPTRKYLTDAITVSYTNLGWSVEDINDETPRELPTLSDVSSLLEELIDKSSYDSEMKGNLRSFLQVRLGSLMERDAGEVFNTPVSTIAPGEWLEKSAVVELEALSNQATSFFILLIAHYIYEGLRADPLGGKDKCGNPRPVRHALFIEEAHNLVAPTSIRESDESENPKVAATAYIVKMLAEVRALREAVFISDQLPTALAPEITKNTALKVVHRLTSSDDRQLIGAAIAASPLQLEQMTILPSGDAFVFHDKTQRPLRVHIHKWNRPDVSLEEAIDEDLFVHCITRGTTETAVYGALRSLWCGGSHLEHIIPSVSAVEELLGEAVAKTERGTAAFSEEMLLQADLIGVKKTLGESIMRAYEKLARNRALWRIDQLGSRRSDELCEDLSNDIKTYEEVLAAISARITRNSEDDWRYSG